MSFSLKQVQWETNKVELDLWQFAVILQIFSFPVRSFGTEDRPTDRPVGPSTKIYEYVIFRGNEIKDLYVCQPPRPQQMLEGGLPNDPAIVQVSLLGYG